MANWWNSASELIKSEPSILTTEMIRKAVEMMKESEIKPDSNGDYTYFTNYMDAGNFYHKPVILTEQAQLDYDPDKDLKARFKAIEEEIASKWGK